MPLFSVITPCYNSEEFIEAALESVLSQSYPNIEHIIIDDGSTDGSRAILEGYNRNYPNRVHTILLEAQGGASAARRLGAEIAKGDYLLFLDADDLISSETVASFVSTLSDQPGTFAYCSWRYLKRSHSEFPWTATSRGMSLPAKNNQQAFKHWIEGVSWVPPVAICWSRKAYEQTGGWDETLTLNDDGDLVLRALLEGIPLVSSEGGEAFYRDHASERMSLSQSFIDERKLFSQKRVIDRLASRIVEKGELLLYAASLGIAYQRSALVAFQNGHHALGKVLLSAAKQYCASQPVSRTPAGRILDTLLGIERKEQVVQILARAGIMTPLRRRAQELSKLASPSLSSAK